MKRLRLAVRLSAIAFLMSAQNAIAQVTVREIPLDKCTPERAIFTTSLEASGRAAAFSPRIATSMKEVQAILDKYPDHANDTQTAVKNFLSPDDSVRMTQLFAISTQLNMFSFAEERLDRDFQVLLQMFTLARDGRDGKTDLMKRALATFQADENGNARTGGMEEASVTYVIALRHLFKDAQDLPQSTTSDKCSVDLSLDQEDGRAFSAVGAFERDPEFADLLRIRNKYHAVDGQPLDTAKMPTSEAKYATELQTTVQGKMRRIQDYHADLMNLRRLSALSVVIYEGTREDLIQLGGAQDNEAIAAIGAMSQARYKAASKDVQTIWNLWEKINEQNPTMRMKMLGDKK
jgi:hypothetical protein